MSSKKKISKPQKKRTYLTYHDELIKSLRNDSEEAVLYLNEMHKDEDPRMFIIALKNITEAYQTDIKALTKTKKAAKKPRRATPIVSKPTRPASRAPIHAKRK